MDQAIFKRFVPKPVRGMYWSFLNYPIVYYTKRTLAMYFKSGQQDLLPVTLLDSYKEYEHLFSDCEKNFQTIVMPYIHEFKWLLGRVYNGEFESVDVELYYSCIRKYQPNFIIEIGSGHSTCFALDAIKKNGKGNIICIDPEPRRKLPKYVKHIKSKVEDVDIDIFKTLGSNDILFIDSSHTTQEAVYHTKEILPSLNPGVIIHHHDFLYPYNVYHQNNSTVFGEPDVLLRFYMDNKESYKIITSASYVRYRNLGLTKKLIKSFNWDSGRIPGSLWTKKEKI